jgi:hypothetical protein
MVKKIIISYILYIVYFIKYNNTYNINILNIILLTYSIVKYFLSN